MMSKLKKTLVACGAELMLLAGMAAVSVGVGMIYLPAGIIAGGVLAMGWAVLSMLGGGDGA